MSTIIRSVVKTETLPMLIPRLSNGVDIYFTDDQYIRNKSLMAVNYFPNLNEFSGGPQQKLYGSGVLIANSIFAAQCYLTLESYSGTKFVRNRPLLQFMPFFNGRIGINQGDKFIGQRVNWPKSYVTIAPGVADQGSDVILLFDIDFTEPGTKTRPAKDILQRQLGTEFKDMR